jgi:hypothetical protein
MMDEFAKLRMSCRNKQIPFWHREWKCDRRDGTLAQRLRDSKCSDIVMLWLTRKEKFHWCVPLCSFSAILNNKIELCTKLLFNKEPVTVCRREIWTENQIPRASRTETRLSFCGMWTNNKSTQQINKWMDSTRSGGSFNNFPENKKQRLSVSCSDFMNVSYLMRVCEEMMRVYRASQERVSNRKQKFFHFLVLFVVFSSFQRKFLEDILSEATIYWSLSFLYGLCFNTIRLKNEWEEKYSWDLSRLKSVS